MARNRLALTRDQIARIVGKDPEAVKQFELLFGTVDQIDQVRLEDIALIAESASAMAALAMALLGAKADKAVTITGANGLNGGGDLSADRSIELDAAITRSLTNDTGNLIDSSVTLTDGAGASLGTLANAPSAGDPTKWVAIDDNGTTRYIPAW